MNKERTEKKTFKPKKKLSSSQLNHEEAVNLFSRLDETGHVNEKIARKEKRRRKKTGVGLEIDPLSGKDPSGSNVEAIIRRTALLFVAATLAVILVAQVSCGFIRRFNAGNLSREVNVASVAGALKGGVEWGDGFTQFPAFFSIQEASEVTGRIEVTVVDTTSHTELESMAASYIQATAFATNALLNNNIDTVTYRVRVHDAGDGEIQSGEFFGFLQPSGPLRDFMTFIFTKSTSANGDLNIFCNITGLDEETTARLKNKIGGPVPYTLDSSQKDTSKEPAQEDDAD